MDILKSSTDWAKAEVFSSQFFIFFGVLFIVGCVGFWQLGKTAEAKAFVVPLLVAGVLLMTIGIGIMYANKVKVTSFTEDYHKDAPAFIQSELTRTAQSMSEYQTIVFKVIPMMIVIAALIIIFVDKPVWRASCITIIAMMVVILLVDMNANSRIEAYHTQLTIAAKSNINQE